MKLRLFRKPSSDKNTLGTLYVNGAHECFTLEDPVREEKIYGKTAIPFGTYKIDLEVSPKFDRVLPTLKNVPNFTHIRIHAGNTELDTDGCLLVGDRIFMRKLWYSKRALDRLVTKMLQLPKGEEITIEILQEPV